MAAVQNFGVQPAAAVATDWYTDGSARLAPEAATPREWLFPEADEIIRSIYTRAALGFAPEMIGICSAIAGEGRTTLSVGLAVTIAQDFPNRRVLLVETDVHKPVLAQDFGVAPSPGLFECLVYGDPLMTACRPTFLENLQIVPGGSAGGVVGRPLRSSEMAAILDAMRQTYDIIIVDLPPILVNSDAVLLTDLVDGLICVVRGGVTPTALLNRALQLVDESKVRGVVLNGNASAVPRWLRRLVGA